MSLVAEAPSMNVRRRQQLRVATLLDMAVRGYVTIHEVQLGGPMGIAEGNSFTAKALRSLGIGATDWELRRTDKADSGELTAYEESVLRDVFEGTPCRRMSELQLTVHCKRCDCASKHKIASILTHKRFVCPLCASLNDVDTGSLEQKITSAQQRRDATKAGGTSAA